MLYRALLYGLVLCINCLLSIDSFVVILLFVYFDVGILVVL